VVSCTATTFHDRDSKLHGVFLTARDLTELKRLERALEEKNIELERARAVAEKASLAKSDFLTGMSHDLRAPLNTILGFAQLIDSDTPPPTLAQTASVEQILRSGWHLLELINEIVDLSQIESGKLVLSMEPTSLAEVLRECQAMMVPQGRKRGIKMTFPPSGIPYFVNADRTRLKEILISLLSNAIKYNRLSGTVVVDCALSSSANTPERVRVSIADTGTGLSPDMLPQLFQPFNRLGRDRSVEEGAGIGLAMSKRLVELMGGVIGAESTIGSGSVFWFELNAATEPRLALDRAQAAIVEVPVRHGEPVRSTVLCVEDNPANLELIKQIIARSPNISLLTAEDGVEGIQLARAKRPDVILMDINLPGISGTEALTILRADPATAYIPVVALSANAMIGDVEKGLKAGFFRYLSKPIKVNEFMETLEVALEFAALGRGH
jgi:signal transduction histidine kinase/CheY-like chemotaxis protein